MHDRRHDGDAIWRSHRSRRANAAGALLLAALALTACGGDESSEPDVSPEGQVRYACALASNVEQAHGEPLEWTDGHGPDGEPGWTQAAAISALVGGLSPEGLPDYPQLAPAGSQLYGAVASVEPELAASALDDIIDGCDDVADETAPDVSREGQTEYACALAGYVIDEHGEPGTWGGYTDSPGWHQAFGVGALMGGATFYVIDGEEELSDAGLAIVRIFRNLDTARLQEHLETVATGCE